MSQPHSVRHLAISLIWAVFAAAPAVAEDFSGFYAGVNAGYAFDRTDREADTADAFASTRDDRDLPPSAAVSTLATRRQRDGAPTRTRSR